MEFCVNAGCWLLEVDACVLGDGETVFVVSLVFIVSLVSSVTGSVAAWFICNVFCVLLIIGEFFLGGRLTGGCSCVLLAAFC